MPGESTPSPPRPMLGRPKKLSSFSSKSQIMCPDSVLEAIRNKEVDRSGWLEKSSGGKTSAFMSAGNLLGKWDRRWAVVYHDTLYYFKSEQDAADGAAAGTFDLCSCTLEWGKDDWCFTIRSSDRTLSLRLPSGREAREWAHTVETASEQILPTDADGCCGWLEKRSGGKPWRFALGNALDKWDKRWFVLKEGVLKYFRNKSDLREVGAVDCRNATIEFGVGREPTLAVHTALRVLMLRAASLADLEMWTEAIEEVCVKSSRNLAFGDDDDTPPPSDSELAVAALKEIKRECEFGTLLTVAQHRFPLRPEAPSLADSKAAGGALSRLERGPDFEAVLGVALRQLAHVGIPAMAATMPQDGETASFHMHQGVWWPSALPPSFVEGLGSFWKHLVAPPLERSAGGDMGSSNVVTRALRRSMAYEDAEVRWRADEGNPVKIAAASEGFSFLVHSVHIAGLSAADAEALEATRKVSVDTAVARAAVYEAADAADGGLIDWEKAARLKASSAQ